MTSASLRSDEFLDVDGLVVEVYLSEVVHVVAELGLHEVVGEHGVEEGRGEGDAVAREHVEVVLHVLPHLEDAAALDDGTEDGHHALGRFA